MVFQKEQVAVMVVVVVGSVVVGSVMVVAAPLYTPALVVVVGKCHNTFRHGSRCHGPQ